MAWRLTIGLLGLALLLTACGGGGSDPTATAPAIETPTATATAEVDSRRTGIPELDAVLDAVRSHDPAAVRPFIGFETVACIGPTPGSLGALFCEDGEAPGTAIEALGVAQCEGHYLRADDMDQALQSMTDPTVELYAVARTENGYRAVFSRLVGPDLGTALGYALQIEGGSVTFVNFGCGESAEELVDGVSPEDFALPPKE